jgi:chromosome segregation ATPase
MEASWISQDAFQAASKEELLKEASKVIDSLKNELNHVKAEQQSSTVLHGTSCTLRSLTLPEHELHTLEQKHVAVLSTNKSLQEQVQDLEKERESLREQADINRKKCTELTKSCDEAKEQVFSLKEELQRLERDKLSLTEVIEKKDAELESINESLQQKDRLFNAEMEESMGIYRFKVVTHCKT